jgi:hypothetical protein
MNSKIVDSIGLKTQPVVIIFQDEAPEGAVQFKERSWGCTLWLMAGAAKGRTAACSRKTFGCFGGGVGAGFGDQYQNFPGGLDGFCKFLSVGNEGDPVGEKIAEEMKKFARPEFVEDFLKGERYLKTPEDVLEFTKTVPMTDIPTEYVVYKPLSDIDESVNPVSVTFFCDPDQFAAIGVLANFSYPGIDNVIFPFAGGCQAIGIYSYAGEKGENPKAVAGMMDISARLNLRNQFGENVMSMSLPWKMFLEMEKNVDQSFLKRHSWHEIMKTKK